MLSVGSYFARGQKTSEEYLLAGRSMRWLPMAISVMAAGQSAISYIGVPAWTYQHDMTIFVMNFTFLAVAPILGYVILPVYHRLKVSTAYEYLETRFDNRIRS